VKRTGGVFYKKETEEQMKTPFNEGTERQFGVEFVARAFNDHDYPLQTSFATSSDDDLQDLMRQKDEIMDLARKVKSIKEGREGRYNVIFSPLCFASLVSYTVPMASAFQVDSGMSMFAGRMREKVGSRSFTVYDDPTDDSMFNSRTFDDEGAQLERRL
jgi:Predicted Zn-dependent proteases and their inactivated homologs